MKNKIIVILIIFTALISIFLTFSKKEEYKEIPQVKVKEQIDSKQFALMIEQTSGKGDYEESNDELPTIGYNFNKEKSKCIDINGQEIKDTLDYNYDDYIVLLDTSKTSYCYLYYDKLTLGETIRKANSKGLNSEMEGGLYRYQGAKGEVDNYVCLNEKCNSNNRYRIIGINEANEVKLIKEESYGKNSYYEDDNVDIEWPESNVYKSLNINEDSFYNTLSNDIKDMVVAKDYYYAKMGYNFFIQTSKDGSKMYKVETGQEKSSYFENVPLSEEGKDGVKCRTIDRGEHLNEKKCYITKNEFAESDKSNIGIMYIHDYYYSVQTGGYDCTADSKNEVCMTSWLFNNVTEWLMTLRGYADDYATYGVYCIISNRNGLLTSQAPKSIYNYRPVFYIKNDLRVVDGKGTIEAPFIIKK